MRTIARSSMVTVLTVAAAGCTGNLQTSLERLVEARRLSTDLLVQFSRAADAANLAVMADTDESSVAFVGRAQKATQTVQEDTAALAKVLADLGYAPEVRRLEQFKADFAEYSALDREILGLAVANTNLKAQRLSFGAAQEAANAFREALEALEPWLPLPHSLGCRQRLPP